MAASAALTGAGGDGMYEPEVMATRQDIYITLTDETWETGQDFDDARQAIIDGFDAAANPTNGWNNQVRDKLSVVTVKRLSSTQVLLSLPGLSGYAIASDETITCIVPISAIAGSGALTATPTITITATAGGTAITSVNMEAVPNNYLICQRTGFKIPVNEGLVKDGYGMWVRAESRDRRHPQEFVRSRPEQQKGSVAPEPEDTFTTTRVLPADL